jgi:hypothetical protein
MTGRKRGGGRVATRFLFTVSAIVSGSHLGRDCHCVEGTHYCYYYFKLQRENVVESVRVADLTTVESANIAWI